MSSFNISSYSVELFNTRDEHGALRVIEIVGAELPAATPHTPGGAGAPSDGIVEPSGVRVRLLFLAGEPRPRVEERDGGCWEVSFPLAHYEPVLDLLRHAGPLTLVLDPPERVVLQTSVMPASSLRG